MKYSKGAFIKEVGWQREEKIALMFISCVATDHFRIHLTCVMLPGYQRFFLSLGRIKCLVLEVH